MSTVEALLSLSDTSRSADNSPEKSQITILPAHNPDKGRYIDRLQDRYLDIQMDRQMDRQIDSQMGKYIRWNDEQIDRQLDT